MKINPSARMPTPTSDQHLVRIDACALNPVDHKPAELFIVDKLLNSKPATPGIDFAGRIVKPCAGSDFKAGDLVFGCAGKSPPFANGALSEYALVERDWLARIPAGVSTIDAATVGVAGLTALQSIGSELTRGSKIFINGGSGGTGIFGIQIAKQKGLWVATTCSTANIGLCKSLGADHVIDYRTTNVVDALKASGDKFDKVIDNIGADLSLYWRCHEYTKPGARYIMVGAADLGLSMLGDNMKMKLWPSVLGGGRRKKEGFFAQANEKELSEIGEWMRQGKVKTVIDSTFPFEEAVQAFQKLKTGRAKGKVVVEGAR